MAAVPPTLTDPFGRAITYLRVSVTDRCDLRCLYCMPERMRFLPKQELLSASELDRLCGAFIRRGVRKLRLTGGEPLVRRDFMALARALSRHLSTGALHELTLTTNATQLAAHASELAAIGIRRINVSLDTIDRETFARITRRDRLASVLAGIAAAQRAGLTVKINTVALLHDNAAEIPALIAWAHAREIDVTLIETMPLGEIDQDRTDQYISLQAIRRTLESRWTLVPSDHATGGPARYVLVKETGRRIGFITPISRTFCNGCNRVRLTCAGKLYLCLGHDDHIDFRAALRAGASDDDLDALVVRAISLKPEAHAFSIDRAAPPAVERHMSATGG
jgi:cyclic pyranopterin phosphate synthase